MFKTKNRKDSLEGTKLGDLYCLKTSYKAVVLCSTMQYSCTHRQTDQWHRTETRS